MKFAVAGEGDQTAVGRVVEALRDAFRDPTVPTPKDYGIYPARWNDLLPLVAE